MKFNHKYFYLYIKSVKEQNVPKIIIFFNFKIICIRLSKDLMKSLVKGLIHPFLLRLT
jgi:hypothetical protein